MFWLKKAIYLITGVAVVTIAIGLLSLLVSIGAVIGLIALGFGVIYILAILIEIWWDSWKSK